MVLSMKEEHRLQAQENRGFSLMQLESRNCDHFRPAEGKPLPGPPCNTLTVQMGNRPAGRQWEKRNGVCCPALKGQCQQSYVKEVIITASSYL